MFMLLLWLSPGPALFKKYGAVAAIALLPQQVLRGAPSGPRTTIPQNPKSLHCPPTGLACCPNGPCTFQEIL